ncbi:hypothetical protein [Serratia fonticola]|uniref:hypothetical protein n=1 Tax=Serratia fonticola TaxID=47917 RepID=UPI00301CB983
MKKFIICHLKNKWINSFFLLILLSPNIYAMSLPNVIEMCVGLPTIQDMTGSYDAGGGVPNGSNLATDNVAPWWSCNEIPYVGSYPTNGNRTISIRLGPGAGNHVGFPEDFTTTVPGIEFSVTAAVHIIDLTTGNSPCYLTRALSSVNPSISCNGNALSPTDRVSYQYPSISIAISKYSAIPIGSTPVRLRPNSLILNVFGHDIDISALVQATVTATVTCTTQPPVPNTVTFGNVIRQSIAQGANVRVAGPQQVSANARCDGQANAGGNVLVTFNASSGMHGGQQDTLQTSMPDFFLRFTDNASGTNPLRWGTNYVLGQYPNFPANAPNFVSNVSKNYYWFLYHDSTTPNQMETGVWTANATYDVVYQ